MPTDVVMEMKNISKEFPGVKALNGINFTLKKGQVHALLGENGAGKSTLMKILSGVYKQDEGEIYLNGKKVSFQNTREAQSIGINIIHQELNLCGNLSVAANIYIGKEDKQSKFVLDGKTTAKKAQKLLEQLEIDYIDVNEKVGNLSVAQQQMVEIAKALTNNSKVLIMDEPTSALTDKETTILFKTIKTLKESGVSIIYISHRLDEIFKICDEITVIRDGSYVGSLIVNEATTDKLISMMVGRKLVDMYPTRIVQEKTPEYVIEVEALKKVGMVEDISFKVKKGEIYGLSGLVGSGRTELAKLIFGRYRKDSGVVKLHGKPVEISSPLDAIQNGIALVTEDRKAEGLFLILSILNNISVANMSLVANWLGVVKSKTENQLALDGINKLRVKTPSEYQKVKNLSGGNQQKVILAKWLATKPSVLILDEPTRGIDVGSKSEIYTIMRDLAKAGVSIIMISSELPEILGMCDRIGVMRSGKLVAELDVKEATQENIMYYSTGGN